MNPGLVADLGGTHARFALFDGRRLLDPVQLRSSEFAHPVEAVEHYLRETNGSAQRARPSRAVFAVASPVHDDEVVMTNSTWRFSRSRVMRELRLERLEVMNDFAALSLSLPELRAADCRRIREGEADPRGPKALLGPGTGLGVGGLLPAPDGGWAQLQGEGGHIELCAVTEREWQIRQHLAERHGGRTSAERVLSGPGLAELYATLASLDGVERARLEPPEIVRLSANGGDAQATEAVNRFSRWLGAVAGDLALLLGARGGVYLGGGMLERMGDAFSVDLFLRGFMAKGRLSSYLATLPVDLIVYRWASLLGASKMLGGAGPDPDRGASVAPD